MHPNWKKKKIAWKSVWCILIQLKILEELIQFMWIQHKSWIWSSWVTMQVTVIFKYKGTTELWLCSMVNVHCVCWNGHSSVLYGDLTPPLHDLRNKVNPLTPWKAQKRAPTQTLPPKKKMTKIPFEPHPHPFWPPQKMYKTTLGVTDLSEILTTK